MFITELDRGYNPRRHPKTAFWVAFQIFTATLIGVMAFLVALAPIHPLGIDFDLIQSWDAIGGYIADRQLWLRAAIAAAVAAVALLPASEALGQKRRSANRFSK